FTAQTTPNSRTRFKIITIKNQTAVAGTMLKMEQQQKSIVLKNNSENYGELIIYSVSGSILKRLSFSSNSMINFSTADIQTGIYLVKAFTNVDEITEKLLIR
ncbi:MAG: T9SS type A sorting domain-containing protein, partial [Bacteroidetes bacterium]|nr:T9SS type A sorting domain-containing protein [Bacteroidota bacterium]